jgi:prevent-host-death family protein
MEVNIRDARNRLTELVKRAEEGEEIVLTRHGRPTAKLVALAPTERALGQAKGEIREIDKEWWKAMTDEEAEAFYRGEY